MYTLKLEVRSEKVYNLIQCEIYSAHTHWMYFIHNKNFSECTSTTTNIPHAPGTTIQVYFPSNSAM